MERNSGTLSFFNIFFKKTYENIWWNGKIVVRLHSQKRNKQFGALVQLVRMPACHAGGHESESRTHRKPSHRTEGFFMSKNKLLC